MSAPVSLHATAALRPTSLLLSVSVFFFFSRGPSPNIFPPLSSPNTMCYTYVQNLINLLLVDFFSSIVPPLPSMDFFFCHELGRFLKASIQFAERAPSLLLAQDGFPGAPSSESLRLVLQDNPCAFGPPLPFGRCGPAKGRIPFSFLPPTMIPTQGPISPSAPRYCLPQGIFPPLQY